MAARSGRGAGPVTTDEIGCDSLASGASASRDAIAAATQ